MGYGGIVNYVKIVDSDIIVKCIGIVNHVEISIVA